MLCNRWIGQDEDTVSDIRMKEWVKVEARRMPLQIPEWWSVSWLAAAFKCRDTGAPSVAKMDVARLDKKFDFI